MNASAARWAQKVLARLSHFEFIEKIPSKSEVSFELLPGEFLVGCYRNRQAGVSDIWITSHGVRLFDLATDESRMFRYSLMQSATTSHAAAKAPQDILLTLKSGESHCIPILGRQERFFDAFEFLRFILRVMDEEQSRIRSRGVAESDKD